MVEVERNMMKERMPLKEKEEPFYEWMDLF